MGISLAVLEGGFVRRQGSGYHEEPTIESADGILFVCPLCWLAFKPQAHGKDGPQIVRGVHSVLCWRPRVPAGIDPGPGRWELQGTGIGDVTLVAGSSSIQLQGGCNWHGYVRNGECVDGLEAGDIERARVYDRAVRQTIIDREIAMTGTSTSTAPTPQPGAAPAAKPEKAGPPPGFVRTMELRMKNKIFEQRWQSGHGNESVWVAIDGQ